MFAIDTVPPILPPLWKLIGWSRRAEVVLTLRAFFFFFFLATVIFICLKYQSAFLYSPLSIGVLVSRMK